MTNNIHPTAIVSNKAKIGSNVKIGPFSIIEANTVIGDNTEIHSNVLISENTTIGSDCFIFHGAVIGNLPQDLKFDPDLFTETRIGNRTTIREYATIHRGTDATKLTSVGDDCLIMAYSHVAHDCHLGNRVIMANTTQLGGHVTVEDWVIFGGGTIVHQFTVVGCHSMLQGGSRIGRDIPPYTLIGKDPAQVEGLNRIGLKRRGFTDETIRMISAFYETVLHSGLNNSDGIKKYLEDNPEPIEEIKHCIKFIKKSQRGITR